MSRIGLTRAVEEEISRHIAFGGTAEKDKLVLEVGKDKLAANIVDAVTSYIKKEIWTAVKNYILENILS